MEEIEKESKSVLIETLAKKLGLEYEAAIKAASRAVTLRYDEAAARTGPIANEFHVGYRLGSFEENQRLKKRHTAILKFVTKMEALAKPGGSIDSALNTLLGDIL